MTTTPTALPLCVTIVQTPDDEMMGRRELVQDRSVTLGRDGDWSLMDHAISRRHVQIGSEGQETWVQDEDSKNGTWVDGLRIEGRVELPLPAVIRAGTTVVVAERAPLSVDGVTISGVAIGRHPTHLQMLANLEQVAVRSTPVLLVGETGTDRSAVARYIHALSRRTAAFVALDGQDADAEALQAAFEGCRAGTLFVDNVTDLGEPEQAWLSERFGADEGEPDVRLVAATARVLKEASDDGSFRRDLYAILASYPVKLPALRDRLTDIIPLFQHFLKEAVPGWEPTLHGELAEALLLYEWPSNERELRATAFATAEASSGMTYLDVPALPQALIATVGEALARRGAPQPERAAVVAALEGADGDVARAAKTLGSSRVQLYRWLQAYELTADAPA